jgi:KipI family sensor histidine kinase inhibitor
VTAPVILAVGDTAVSVEFGGAIDRAINARVMAFDENVRTAIAAGRLLGAIETVPTFRALMVHYDPLVADFDGLSRDLLALVPAEAGAARAGRRWRLPVAYGGRLGPDLEDVGVATGLAAEEVVRRHTAGAYFVYMMGFLPGFAFMGDVAAPLALRRRARPRTRIVPGSVGIAVGLTGVYPLESPGGWHLLGHTPVLLFDTRREPMVLLAPGDTVRFAAVEQDEHDAIAARVAAGTWRAEEALEG